jgi:hypothetical protein
MAQGVASMGASVCTLAAAVNGAFGSGEPGGTTATTPAMNAHATIHERGAPVSQSEKPRHSDAHPAATAPLPLPAVHGDELGVLRQPDRLSDTDTPSGTAHGGKYQVFLSFPPGGRCGWGDGRPVLTPTLALPRRGGGERLAAFPGEILTPVEPWDRGTRITEFSDSGG